MRFSLPEHARKRGKKKINIPHITNTIRSWNWCFFFFFFLDININYLIWRLLSPCSISMRTKAYLLKSSSIKVSHPPDSKLPEQLVMGFIPPPPPAIPGSFVILQEDVISNAQNHFRWELNSNPGCLRLLCGSELDISLYKSRSCRVQVLFFRGNPPNCPPPNSNKFIFFCHMQSFRMRKMSFFIQPDT